MNSQELADVYHRAEIRWFKSALRARLDDPRRIEWKNKFCARAISLLVRWNDIGSAGISGGQVDHHGEYELLLEVNGHKGSVWISKEMWESIGEHAGWVPPSG